VIGFLIGIVPGPAAILASLASYAVEKRLARQPEEFGRGAIEGVAGPEAANNAATGGAFVPLLALGIPFAPATAVLLGALMIHGIRPGPLLMQQRPELFWGVVASMYLGNLMLLVLNLPLVGVFASALRIPRPYLFSSVLVLTIVGAYSVNNAVADVWLLLAFGVVGYLMRLFDFDPAPLVLALVLGPMLETSFRQSLIMARGDVLTFVERPLSAVFLALAALLLIGQLVAAWRARGAGGASAG
jgi:putative tricarboxylic transport membrane protein